MSLGLRESGCEVVAAYDAWPIAVENYNRNLGIDRGKVADLGDLLTVVPELLTFAPDMIVGGPRVRTTPVPAAARKPRTRG